ncbi:MAG: DNA mismatch repair protein MutS [Rhodospirillaceae bacterium]|nr:MAG: DNA mismatch repair protein MutS [Rhodospirillaceae bacterium]
MTEPPLLPVSDLTSDSTSDSAVTPVMGQFLAIKREHPECLLFYRMGDFYEMFFEDAVQAAAALDIALTKRGRHQGEDIPMCGVPVRNHAAYLARLVRKGFRVAICEQMEDPAEAHKRGAKAVLERAVVRVVTAGTLTEDELLEARDHNYLTALAESQGALGLAWVDVSTGDFQVQTPVLQDLGAVLARISPGEVLVSERLLQRADVRAPLAEWLAVLNPQPPSRFDGLNARLRLEALYGVASLEGFGAFEPAEIAAAGALIDYITLTQKGHLPRLPPPRRLRSDAVMALDAATRRNLEILKSQSGDERNALRTAIDRTLTGGGARLLAHHLAAPLTDPAAIAERLDAVQFFHDHERVRTTVREKLRCCPDIERALSRLSVGRGGPRDLAALRDALAEGPGMRIAIVGTGSAPAPPVLLAAVQALGHHAELVDRLARALVPDLPLQPRDGGFIAEGYDPALDSLRLLRDESGRLITALQHRYATATGLATLKVAHNNVLGFYIEVPARQADKLMADPEKFIHRQTMANTVRFTTVELSALEGRRHDALEKALALEGQIFDTLVGEVTRHAEDIAAAAQAMAVLDVVSALGALAVERHYCRPVVDRSTDFEVTGGRHPVVEAGRRDAPFVTNDCRLNDAGALWLLTGPNMAGKSTFLRQNALMAVLAQAGSFVPAESARIGVVDRLFSRVGAADDLARGHSTFMVEMIETSAILNQATARSFVILDEIGRGTATFDGLSIAWATVEHLHDVVRCRGIFATHYHELTALAGRLPRLACHTMRIREWHDQIIFLHEVAAGAADRSYGLHVARLAGLPDSVLARAQEVLAMLENSGQRGAVARLIEDLPLFAAARPKAVPTLSQVERLLAGIEPDRLSPRQALEFLYELKAAASNDKNQKSDLTPDQGLDKMPYKGL